jgi:hypothetical protein
MENNNNALSPQQIQQLTPQQKKQYLMNKYVKRDYKVEDIESIKKYAVYFCPNLQLVKEWTLICVTNTRKESENEIAWRMHYINHKDADLVVDNDKNFSTWRDETKNVNSQGVTYEPGEELMKIDYNTPGNVFQVIANSAPVQQNNNGFKGLASYVGIEIGNYHGFYEIREIYEITEK